MKKISGTCIFHIFKHWSLGINFLYTYMKFKTHEFPYFLLGGLLIWISLELLTTHSYAKMRFKTTPTTFQDMSLSSPSSMGTTQRGTSKGRPTVVDTFRAQLQSLVDMLQATDVW